ncbi:hypothetical protein GDO86_005931 [Hymenochirus boettgeri]|uniref:Reelin n=1 Tax=Hymenochirus boettgeri TaxID=247094 RepID=A0A8T2J9H3_9PIPI|nr:hypothetical protein GDO86_005931 [Hymenochirus boettgeri]
MWLNSDVKRQMERKKKAFKTFKYFILLNIKICLCRLQCRNCEVGEQCGIIMHGGTVSFCEPYGPRELITVHVNTTTASVLQFSIGSGSCRFSYTDPGIVVSYTKNNSRAGQFSLLNYFSFRSAPSNVSTIIHIIYLPSEAKGENVRFRWRQENVQAGDVYEACWALDNILIINSAHKDVLLEDNLDPIDTGNWLFFPGATVKHSCQSDGNSIYFHGTEGNEYNFATTRDVDLSNEDIQDLWSEEFENLPAGWEITGAVIGTECGTVESGLSLVFLKDGERKLCTPFMDTTEYGNLRFYFIMGGMCSPGESHDNDVLLYGQIDGSKEHIVMDTLSYSSYKVPALVSTPISPYLQTPATRFCLKQSNHRGHNLNVWAVDFFHVLPVLPSTESHMVQFSINLGCGSHQSGNSVSLEFSTNHGRSWSLMHSECLPELCAGSHLPHSTIYSSDNYSGWSRITIPLPNAALTKDTRLRWRQNGPVVGNMWALDNIYVGPSCLKFCSGRGQCTRTGCKCEPGFSGPACEMASQTFPSFISESFTNSRLSSYHNFYSIRGAEVTFGCGVLASGKALVFNKDGRRQLITALLDSSQSRFLQFTLRIGSKSVLSTCKAPDRPGEGVLLHYSHDNGITWKLLEHFSYLSYHEPRIISVELPKEAKQFGIQFRWWQPYHSGQGEDVWAVDEITMTSVLFNSISLNFTNLVEVTQSLGFYLGNVQPYCGHDWTLCFTGDSKQASSPRYVETQSMQIGASYMIQFSLVMGCGEKYTPHMDNQVMLEYSTNHGLTWHLVQEILSSATRFRWSQRYYTSEDDWALDNIYIGQQCSNMCSGHGWCNHGICRCDSGYQASQCLPEILLPSTVMSDFEGLNGWEADWQEVVGGEIVKPEQGCGVISSGSSLYFYKDGRRQLVSWDMDTTWADFIQFYIQIGGENSLCNTPDSREEGVLLQYSNNGGINWHLLAEMYFSDFTKPKFVYLELPSAARTPCTRFRWWQPVFSGEGYDQWAVDDIIILSENQKQIIPVTYPTLPQNFYEKPAFDYPMSQMSVWLMLANEGMIKNESFCSVTPSAMIFGKSDGDRFAVTRDLTLKPGYVLQFKLNVGCTNEFSNKAPVLLQYSHDAGLSWSMVREECYPASPGKKECEGSSRELRESTSYYTGDYEDWTRKNIVIPRSIASSKTRFRWIQESSSFRNVPAFGLDGVYISEPCPNYCNGYGDCISGVCFCDRGYTAEHGTCVSNKPNPSEMFDRFEGKLSQQWYKITGGQVGMGCGTLSDGKSLYFDGPGKREARTTALDTTNIRLVQFYIQIGSKNGGLSCSKPKSRNEGIVVQYTNDNGISWNLLRELDFMSFLEPQIISIELPRNAKTSFTAFRWWQPQHGKQAAEWALDDVLIGMNDSSRNGFQEKFESSVDLHSNWYRIQGGQVDVDCLSMDTALIFSENIGKPRYAETWDFHVMASSSLQFDLSMGCSKHTSDAHVVQLQYSINNGKVWQQVTEECVPPSIGCLHYTESSIYSAERFQNWKRVTIYLPPATIYMVGNILENTVLEDDSSLDNKKGFLSWGPLKCLLSHSTRFRWNQPSPFDKQQTWAIDNVYIGDGCVDMCSGHGRCVQGSCMCDENWGGTYCDEPEISLPTQLKDTFNRAPSSHNWLTVNGGKLSSVCGAVASGMALHFSGGCSRLLVSVDLNLTNAEFIQFYFMYGCLIIPHSRNQGVLLEYSVNGGINCFVNILLPTSAKTVGTRFRWWQPKHDGLDQNDWAIDNVLISGSADQSIVMLDTFSSAPLPQHERTPADAGPIERVSFEIFDEDRITVNEHWMFHDDCSIERFCQSPDGVMICGSHDGREVYTVTHDLTPAEGWIMQFKISVGCKSSEKNVQNQVHVQYSTDFGVSWNYLVPQCLPADPKCSGSVSQPSVFFPTKGWKRVVYPLPDSLVGNPVRFRFYQKYSDTQWAIDNFYIGPGCLNNCNGHGDCLREQCICDAGYSGTNCYLTQSLKTFLKERFDNDEIKSNSWQSIEGGKPCTECGVLAEDMALYFGGSALRQAITQDLDLRGAKFVQYWARIGITWTLLHEMDYQKYMFVRYDYILLPEQAQTNTTRLRWWQPFTISNGFVVLGQERSQWALDNILIGGAEINPSQLVDTFDDEGTSHEEHWNFYPNAVRTAGFCGNPSFHLYWPNKKKDKTHNILSSRELIIQPGYMMQFKIVVGCEVSTCIDLHSVILEYTKDSRTDSWQLVQTQCLPSSSNSVGCSPFLFHEATIYNSVNSSVWKRVTLQLPDHVSSSATQFRWIQKGDETEKQSWAVDHVYIGEACPKLCSGRGYCTTGAICICDEGFQGDDCSIFNHDLSSYIKDNFESEKVTDTNWENIQGGAIGNGCGQLSPYAHGDSLYFNGCQIRQAITKPLDLTRASKIMFVLQIGSIAQTDSCKTNLSDANTVDKAVLLQYSVNNGITWQVIAQHQPKDFIQAQRVSYNIPLEARMKGVLLRWWQPRHSGIGHDQWALDHVEVVL